MKRLPYAVLVFLCLGVSLYAAVAYGLLPLGKLVHPDMRANFNAHALGIRLHVFASIVALALGPLQFSSRIRSRHLRLHRWMGRAYLGIGVGIGGASGLYMAMFAYGGPVARLGFACLAIAWIYTGVRAYRSIRGGDVAAHRAWMVRNFALTLAAVSLRIYLPLSMALGIDFATAYRVIAWACWVPNLLVALYWTRPPVRTSSAALRSPAR